jgi:hypothetical protein
VCYSQQNLLFLNYFVKNLKNISAESWCYKLNSSWNETDLSKNSVKYINSAQLHKAVQISEVEQACCPVVIVCERPSPPPCDIQDVCLMLVTRSDMTHLQSTIRATNGGSEHNYCSLGSCSTIILWDANLMGGIMWENTVTYMRFPWLWR